MEEKSFIAMTVEDAKLFFERCLEREAVTLEERVAILKEMAEEKRILVAGKLDKPTSEAVDKFMEKTKRKGIIGFRKNKS